MRVVWTSRSLRHLASIGTFLEARNPGAATRTVEAVRDKVEALQANPLQGRVGRNPGTRELVITGTSYIVVYRPRRDRLDIIAVMHGAHLWPKRFTN